MVKTRRYKRVRKSRARSYKRRLMRVSRKNKKTKIGG